MTDYFDVARKATKADNILFLCVGNSNYIEIGCFTKALVEGIYATKYGMPKEEDEVIFLPWNEISLGQDIEKRFRLVDQWGDHEFNFYYLKDYGITWAFTENELRGANDTTNGD